MVKDKLFFVLTGTIFNLSLKPVQKFFKNCFELNLYPCYLDHTGWIVGAENILRVHHLHNQSSSSQNLKLNVGLDLGLNLEPNLELWPWTLTLALTLTIGLGTIGLHVKYKYIIGKRKMMLIGKSFNRPLLKIYKIG